MIKFFRKIRQNLLSTGKTSQYLMYAIGEIVLVVVGILIALQINNWNETRKKDIAETEFINGIKKDLAQDKDYINLVIKLAEGKDSIYTILNKDLVYLYESDKILLDSLLKTYFTSQRTFYPISGSFESAISGNEISKFRNKKFTSAVTKLYNSTYARLMDNAKDTDNRWFYLTKKYSQIRRTGHIQDMSKTELNDFLNDIFYHMYGLNHYKKNLGSAITEIDELLLEYQ